MIRVAVAGATGRMGSEVCRAVAADPELTLDTTRKYQPQNTQKPPNPRVRGFPMS